MVFVLAVEIHQVPPQLRQGGYRGRLAVDERLALAFAVQFRLRVKSGAVKWWAARTSCGNISVEKTALTLIFCAPSLMVSASPRAPNTKPNASITMDLPAPVSPEKTFNPGPNESSNREIMAKFCMESFVSIYSCPTLIFCLKR